MSQSDLDTHPQAGDVPKLDLFIASPEDVIISKLDWYVQGGEVSERQWSDIQGVLKVQEGLLDLNYLNTWVAKLGLVQQFERALKDAY